LTTSEKFLEELNRAKGNAAYFAEAFLQIKPFPYQESFLTDEGKEIAAACGRQVGKTTLAAIKGLHFAFFHPDVTVLIISSTLRQSMILFSKIRAMIESNPILRMKVKNSTRTKIEFDHRSRIIALPCGPTGYSLRGHTGDMIIVDEANYVPEEVVDGVIRPMLIARANSSFIMLSTPWTRNHPFYRAVAQKELGFHVYSWPTSLNSLVSKKKLEADRNALDPLTFRREYEAQFVEEHNSYFPSSLVSQCIDGSLELLTDQEVLDDEYEYEGVFHLGVDFGKRADHSVLAVLERNTDHTLSLVYLKEFPLQTNYATVTGWIRRLNEAFRFETVTLDQTGVGEAPVEDVKNFLQDAEGVILTSKMKLDVLSNLQLLLQHERLRIPLERSLIAQLNEQQYDIRKTGELTFSHPPRSHDDQLWSLALSAWGARKPAGPNFLPITRSFSPTH
jgi:Terminase large subunit, T4likevirus-type, N-terminal/Terminase RNaseH-like domain